MTDNTERYDENKDSQAEANATQSCQIDSCPASDIYAEVEKDPETCVDVPTEESVKDAKDWVDIENRK